MGTNEIMDALKGVQMTAKNKSKLANSIMKASGGQNVVVKESLMKYYYYKNEPIDGNTTLFTWLVNIKNESNGLAFFNIISKAVMWSDDNRLALLNDGWTVQSGYDEPIAICVHGLVTMDGKPIDLAEAMVLSQFINSDTEIDINSPGFIAEATFFRSMFKPLEITEEEFFEGFDTSR